MSALIASKWYPNGKLHQCIKSGFIIIVSESDTYITYMIQNKEWFITLPKSHFFESNTQLTDEQKLELL